MGNVIIVDYVRYKKLKVTRQNAYLICNYMVYQDTQAP